MSSRSVAATVLEGVGVCRHLFEGLGLAWVADVLQIALKSCTVASSQTLGEDPSFPELLMTLDQQR